MDRYIRNRDIEIPGHRRTIYFIKTLSSIYGDGLTLEADLPLNQLITFIVVSLK